MDNVPVRVSNSPAAERNERGSSSVDAPNCLAEEKSLKRGTMIGMPALLVVVLALVGCFAYQSSTAKAIDSGNTRQCSSQVPGVFGK